MYKVQQNTDLWLDPSPLYTSYESADQTIDLTNNGKSDFDKLFDSNYSNRQGGTYSYPSISFNDSNNNDDYSPFGTTFVKDKLNIIYTENVGLDMLFKIYASETKTFEFAVASNDAHELFIDASDILVKNEYESNVEIFKSNYQPNTWDNAISYVTGSEAVTIEADTPKWLKLKWGDEGTPADRGLQFVYRQKGDSSWRNVPVFSDEIFRYLNYDSTGPWLWASNTNGIYKFDPQNMIVREAQPLNKDTGSVQSDIVVDNTYIYAIGSNDYVYQLNKELFVNNVKNSSGEIKGKIRTLHFDQNGYICFGYRGEEPDTEPHFAKIRTSDLGFESIIDLTNVVGTGNGNQYYKVSILPDGSIIIGNDSAELYKLNNDLSYTGKSQNIGSDCTGLIYDIDKIV